MFYQQNQDQQNGAKRPRQSLLRLLTVVARAGRVDVRELVKILEPVCSLLLYPPCGGLDTPHKEASY